MRESPLSEFSLFDATGSFYKDDIGQIMMKRLEDIIGVDVRFSFVV